MVEIVSPIGVAVIACTACQTESERGASMLGRRSGFSSTC
jgi:hypothetical protein